MGSRGCPCHLGKARDGRGSRDPNSRRGVDPVVRQCPAAIHRMQIGANRGGLDDLGYGVVKKGYPRAKAPPGMEGF